MPKCGNKEPQSSNLDCETGSFNTPSRGKIDMGEHSIRRPGSIVTIIFI